MSHRPQIGTIYPRTDAPDKAAGSETYSADLYGPDMLWVGLKRAELPHARIEGVITAEARKLTGVVAVLTAIDVPGSNIQGLVKRDQPVIVGDKVRRVGDPVALVLAESKATLNTALEKIKINLTPLPAVFDMEEALAADAPVIHEKNGNNLLARARVDKGDVKKAWPNCMATVEGIFHTPRQEHAYLETEAGYAQVDSDGRVVVTVSTQSPHRDRLEIAHALGLPPDRVRVIAPYLGGGFGGKDGANVQACLALAAMNAGGRPVKMWWDREESFLAGVKRLPARLKFRLGADASGRLLAIEVDILLDAGAYEHLAGEVLALCVEHAAGPYAIPNVSIEGKAVYTNNPMGGPFRGFGVPQAAAGIEQMMDLLAAELNMNPLALRRNNILSSGDVTPVGVTLTGSTGAAECLDCLAEHPLWRGREEWKGAAPAFKRRGCGLAAVWHGSGYGPLVADYATARIELTIDGRFKVDAGVTDMGQGNASTCLQAAADLLGQDESVMELVLPDTDKTMPCCSSAASRTTYTYVNALIGAAVEMKRRILEKSSILAMAQSAERFVLAPGLVRHLDSGRETPLATLAPMMSAQERVSSNYWRAPIAPDPIRAELDSVVGLPHIVFSYAAHLALIEVDELTGRSDVVEYLTVTDAGRIINPQAYEAQVQGGVVQGLGFALWEDYPVLEGRGLATDLSTYLVPTSLDVPDVSALAVQTHEPTGPFGLKGVGEVPIDGPLPAVANALADALNVRIFEAPMTPERILAALESR